MKGLNDFKIHHIGIAVKDISKTIVKLKDCFPVSSIGNIVFDPLQDASVCLVFFLDGSCVELVSGKAVRNYVKRNILQYHICFETKDLDECILHMTGSGCLLVREKKPSVLFDGRQVAFLFTPIGLVELLEAE